MFLLCMLTGLCWMSVLVILGSPCPKAGFSARRRVWVVSVLCRRQTWEAVIVCGAAVCARHACGDGGVRWCVGASGGQAHVVRRTGWGWVCCAHFVCSQQKYGRAQKGAVQCSRCGFWLCMWREGSCRCWRCCFCGACACWARACGRGRVGHGGHRPVFRLRGRIA